MRDRLFETLDPTTRGFEHDGRRYLLTDTVGFVRRLPHQLVEGFAATLEETLVADLVLHVADASAADATIEAQIAAVEAVLKEIGAGELPRELVLNKIDVIDPLARRRLANRFPGSLLVSAQTGEGLDELRERIAERFADRFERVRLLVPYDEGAALAALYALGAPIEAARGPRGRGADRRPAPAPRAAALRTVPRRGDAVLVRLGPVSELPLRRLDPDGVSRRGPTPATPGSTWPPPSIIVLGPGERAVVSTGLAVAIPEGHAGLVVPRSGLAARHGITIVNAPGLVDSGYRGDVKVVLLNTDQQRDVRRRAGHAHRPARRDRRPGRWSPSRPTRSPRRSAARADTARRGH